MFTPQNFNKSLDNIYNIIHARLSIDSLKRKQFFVFETHFLFIWLY